MNTSAVDSLLAQMRVAAAAAGLREPSPAAQPGKVDFSNVLKSSLDGVAQVQAKAEAMQKASINFQATVQVRNKFVQAYNDIMNMQV